MRGVHPVPGRPGIVCRAPRSPAVWAGRRRVGLRAAEGGPLRFGSRELPAAAWHLTVRGPLPRPTGRLLSIYSHVKYTRRTHPSKEPTGVFVQRLNRPLARGFCKSRYWGWSSSRWGHQWKQSSAPRGPDAPDLPTACCSHEILPVPPPVLPSLCIWICIISALLFQESSLTVPFA